MGNNNLHLVKDLFRIYYYVSFFKEKGIAISLARKKKIEKHLLDKVEDGQRITRYGYKGKKLEYFLQYYKNQDVGQNMIQGDFLWPPNWPLKKVKALVRDIFDRDKRIKRALFYVPVESKIFRQLKKMGATDNGYHFLGRVDDGLDYLRGRKWPKGEIIFANMRKRDIEEVVELEYQAQKNSETNRCGNIARGELRDFYRYCLAKKRKVILSREGKRIVGVVAVSIIDHVAMGHIMAISVKYEEQKRGLAKGLYFEALKFLKSKRVRAYSGVSSTTEVLTLAKKMKRKANFVYLKMERS